MVKWLMCWITMVSLFLSTSLSFLILVDCFGYGSQFNMLSKRKAVDSNGICGLFEVAILLFPVLDSHEPFPSHVKTSLANQGFRL